MNTARFHLAASARALRALGRLVAKDGDGAELFEFALVLPLLATLLLGIVWIGRAYNVYQTITRAAREGTRYAVLPSSVAQGNTYTDTYTTAGTNSQQACLSNPTSIFTNYVSPSLLASNLDPTKVQNFCEQAMWINPDVPSGDESGQCGVQISFQYPVQLYIPFTSLNASTVNISTHAQMRFENQSVDPETGLPTCP